MRDVRDQRPEPGRGADADQHALHEGELPDRCRRRRQHEARAQRGRRRHQRQHDPEPVDQPADDDIAEAEPDHRQRVGHRGARPVDAELRLDIGQRHHGRPHADAADRAEHDADGEAEPRIRPVDGAGHRARRQTLRCHGIVSRVFRGRLEHGEAP